MNNIENFNFNNKRVIIRTDYNVPIINNIIQSTKRIDSSLKTINFILKQNPEKIIIISHLGRPDKNCKELTLKPIKNYLEKVLNVEIGFCNLEDITNINTKIILLENIRFYEEETKILDTTNNFREKLTKLGNVFINDAFGCCHRPHSSIIGINTDFKFTGFLVNNEIYYLNKSLLNGGIKTLVLGGSKVNDKIKLIKNLIPKIDNILIGGGMAFTFLKYKGIKIGKSLYDENSNVVVDDIFKFAKKHNTNIYLPIDFKCSNIFSNNSNNIINCDINTGIPDDYMGLDISQKTIKLFTKILEESIKKSVEKNNKSIIICNGPLGVFEFDNFSKGSKDILEYISELRNSIKIIGGGDIVNCCEKFKVDKKMDHVSTGGGASLALLEGKLLPGLEFVN